MGVGIRFAAVSQQFAEPVHVFQFGGNMKSGWLVEVMNGSTS